MLQSKQDEVTVHQGLLAQAHLFSTYALVIISSKPMATKIFLNCDLTCMSTTPCCTSTKAVACPLNLLHVYYILLHVHHILLRVHGPSCSAMHPSWRRALLSSELGQCTLQGRPYNVVTPAKAILLKLIGLTSSRQALSW